MAVIPVIVRSPDGSRSVVTRAFLDQGSSATFCTASLLQKLNAVGKPANLKMTTATSVNQSVQSQMVEGFAISALDSASTFQLPPTYTLDTLPVRQKDIATSTDIQGWAHLQGITLPQIDIEVELMIGGNCPEALCPLEIRKGAAGMPFAFRSQLGWTVYGPRRHRDVTGHVISQ